MQDWDKVIEAMQEFCAPEAEEKRLCKKWAKASDVKALHIHYDEPAPDGDFEILFVETEKAELEAQRSRGFGRVDIISYVAGVALAKQDNCCGGSFALKDAEIISATRDPNDYPPPEAIELL